MLAFIFGIGDVGGKRYEKRSGRPVRHDPDRSSDLWGLTQVALRACHPKSVGANPHRLHQTTNTDKCRHRRFVVMKSTTREKISKWD
jgi:hypothetical protein